MLQSIAGNMRPVLWIHEATSAVTETSEALVCVELDLVAQRKNHIWIEMAEGGSWQLVSYHRVPHLCLHCHKIGHTKNDCKKRQIKNMIRNSLLNNIDSNGAKKVVR